VLQREGQLVAAGEDRVERREVLPSSTGRANDLPEMIDMGADHRRSPRVQIAEEALRVELLLERNRGAAPEEREHLDPAAHVAHGVMSDDAGFAVDAVERGEHAGDDPGCRGMRVDNPLGKRGRARGVEDERDGVRGDVTQGPWRRLVE
jgi:hypothetical protein